MNAIYHRSYEEREPVEVRITPQELTVLSFPGADRSIRMEDLQTGRAISRRYRNRRIGEFLKELDLAEGTSTGIPKILRAMRENGSAPPVFESDDDRTWFLVRLPVHERIRRGATGQDTEHDVGRFPLQGTHRGAQRGKTSVNTGQDTGQDAAQVTDHVAILLATLTHEMGRTQLQSALRLAHRDHFTASYLRPALEAGLIEMTLPDKPTSRYQRYRRTPAGEALAQSVARDTSA